MLWERLKETKPTLVFGFPGNGQTFGRGSSYAPLAPLGTNACDARGGASRLERTIQSDFLDLGGRPPLRFLRLAV